jgi:hypothetical protein
VVVLGTLAEDRTELGEAADVGRKSQVLQQRERRWQARLARTAMSRSLAVASSSNTFASASRLLFPHRQLIALPFWLVPAHEYVPNRRRRLSLICPGPAV